MPEPPMSILCFTRRQKFQFETVPLTFTFTPILRSFRVVSFCIFQNLTSWWPKLPEFSCRRAERHVLGMPERLFFGRK